MNKNLFVLIIVAILMLIGCSPSGSTLTNAAPTLISTSTPVPTSTPTIKPSKKATAAPSETPLAMPTLRTPESREAFPAKGIAEFHVLHWNDFHGELGEEVVDGTWVPGAARLAAFVKSERAKYDPSEVLLLDAGDWFEGSKFARPSHGMKVLDFYQRLGVNAITVGNHESFLAYANFMKSPAGLHQSKFFQQTCEKLEQLRYTLDGKYTTFVATISLNESACGDGAIFVVILDNQEIYRSENIFPSTKPIPLSLVPGLYEVVG